MYIYRHIRISPHLHIYTCTNLCKSARVLLLASHRHETIENRRPKVATEAAFEFLYRTPLSLLRSAFVYMGRGLGLVYAYGEEDLHCIHLFLLVPASVVPRVIPVDFHVGNLKR